MPEHGRESKIFPINPACQLDPLELRLLGLLERRRHRRAHGDGLHRVNALAIARALGIRPGSSDDSRKKGTPNLVRGMRAKGVPIAAYLLSHWPAAEPAEVQAYYHDVVHGCGLSNRRSQVITLH